MSDGFYYLHTDGNVIYKPARVLDGDATYFDSPFVRKVWTVDTADRLNGWRIALEALAMGASSDRVRQLSEHWGCNRDDLAEYLAREHQAGGVNDLRRDGLRKLVALWGMEFDEVLDEIAAMGTA